MLEMVALNVPKKIQYRLHRMGHRSVLWIAKARGKLYDSGTNNRSNLLHGPSQQFEVLIIIFIITQQKKIKIKFIFIIWIISKQINYTDKIIGCCQYLGVKDRLAPLLVTHESRKISLNLASSVTPPLLIHTIIIPLPRSLSVEYGSISYVEVRSNSPTCMWWLLLLCYFK